jgi:hypothetical protein
MNDHPRMIQSRLFQRLWQFNAVAIALLSVWFAFTAVTETPSLWRRFKSNWIETPPTFQQQPRPAFVPQAVKTTFAVERLTRVPGTSVLLGPVESTNQAGTLHPTISDTVLVDMASGKQQTVRGIRVRNYIFHDTTSGVTHRLLPKDDTSTVIGARALMDDGTALIFLRRPFFSDEKNGLSKTPRRLLFQVAPAAADGTTATDLQTQLYLAAPDGTGVLQLATSAISILGHTFPSPDTLILIARTKAGVRSLQINLATGETVHDRAVFP